MGFFDKAAGVAGAGFSDLASGDPKKMLRGGLAPGLSQATAAGQMAGINDPLNPIVQNSRTAPGSNGFDQAPQMTDRVGFDVNKYSFDPNKAGIDVHKYGNQTTSLEGLKARANSTEASPWLNVQLQQQQLGESGLRDQAASGAAQAQAQARSGLAMRGGLSGGARERLATAGSRDLAQAGQQVGSQGAQARLGLRATDEAQRFDLQKSIPGQELQRAQLLSGIENQSIQNQMQANQFNAGLAQNENNSQNIYNLGKYGEQMKGYAANKSGQAIQNSGGGGKK